MVSSFPGLRALGGLAMVTMLAGFFSDAVFTTSLLRTFLDWPKLISRSQRPGPLLEPATAGVAGSAE